MPPPQATKELYTTLQRYQLLLVVAGRRLWSGMAPTDFDGSWARIAPSLVTFTSGAQLAAAQAATAYVPQVLEETSQPDEPLARIRPRAFAGVASDGRSLPGLLEGSVVAAKRAVVRGLAPDEALIGGQQWLEQALESAVADAMRDATAVNLAVRPGLGWSRMVNPPCCSRCAVLAGKWYRWNEGFQRHPRCFPAGVVVSGPGHEAATRRWYQGELVVLTTASGENLSLTGNHPVLTRRGWVPANLLNEVDEVVRSTKPEGAYSLVVPDHHEVPSRIEDVWGALSMAGLSRVPSTAEDFHGDGQQGEVDVVRADRSLWLGALAVAEKHALQQPLAAGVMRSTEFDGESAPEFVGLRRPAFPGRLIGSQGLRPALVGGHAADPHESRLFGPSPLHARCYEALSDGSARDAILARQGELASAAFIGADDRGHGQIRTSRWDAPGASFSVETREGYASRGLDLLNRLAGQVELDRIVEYRRVEWSGHVYSLTSVEGWHSANSLIVSNCDCVHIPTVEDRSGDFTTDPNELVRRGLITDLSKNQRERLDDGADLSKVLNESRDRWRERMAADRKAAKTWATNTPTAIPPGGVQNFLSHLTSQVDAARALKAADIAE